MTLILLLIPSRRLVCQGQRQWARMPAGFSLGLRANFFSGSMRLRMARPYHSSQQRLAAPLRHLTYAIIYDAVFNCVQRANGFTVLTVP